jgi:hypothetical protein
MASCEHAAANDLFGDYAAGSFQIAAGSETGTLVVYVLTGINLENPMCMP